MRSSVIVRYCLQTNKTYEDAGNIVNNNNDFYVKCAKELMLGTHVSAISWNRNKER